MSKSSVNESANALLDRWLAHHRQQNGEPPTTTEAEPVTDAEAETETHTGGQDEQIVQTVVEFAEFAHPAPTLGGAAGASSSSGPEGTGERQPQQPACSPPVTSDASVPHPVQPPTAPAPAKPPAPAVSKPIRRPVPAPTPGLVLFSPRRGVRRILTGVAALLTAGTGMAGYLAWQAPTSTTLAVAGGLGVALLLVWKLRSRTSGTEITIENGMLRIVQGNSRHLFPLAGSHPPIDILGEPGKRGWKVLIQRRGMPPFQITRRMVEPVGFSEALRHFRPDA